VPKRPCGMRIGRLADEIPSNWLGLFGMTQTGVLGHSGLSHIAMIGALDCDPARRETLMKKTFTVLFAASTLGLATLTSPTPAAAGCYGCGVGAGLLGGFVAGAIVGSALARPYPYAYYGPAPVYYGYYGPAPYYGCSRWRHGYRYRVC